jgi:predicted amidohydrolase
LRKPSYGHSMIIDPWGTVLAQSPDGDGVIVADLDFAAQADIRERLPALRHRRPDAYTNPGIGGAHGNGPQAGRAQPAGTATP